MKKYRDHYFKRAKQESYPARSVYKLKEMDKRFGLLKPGMKALDLGAAPGSWTLYAAERVGSKGIVVGVDLQETDTKFPEQVRFFVDDVFEPRAGFRNALEEVAPFDIVLSDMAPKTTGNKFTDQARSANLVEEALALVQACLINGGNFVVKIFMGPDADAYRRELMQHFRSVKTFKPKSSRSESKEIFYVGLGFKGGRGAQGAPGS
ncbi:50S rRNA methyltransferase [Oceanidesulfovibrio indonesiensis]|uniref:Ribosomal RNA large subunit methyltransferase E n=1 Tax=Oceanidesulfovibrio indonesiensis TaxID=54767 RepID=A0A7M3MK51_9BACT|nr:RlmE family RNA methyltransferase [Oceanidesulfovibrio indonesiensis]TVM19811.1 50S rRNA methyltransferase [Oceanidesulfovibrio indonesiensis]